MRGYVQTLALARAPDRNRKTNDAAVRNSSHLLGRACHSCARPRFGGQGLPALPTLRALRDVVEAVVSTAAHLD
jgi:hypothetical protein